MFLQSFKYGSYYWCRLCTKRVCKDFKIKNWENMMIFMFKVMHYWVSWCIWELLKYVLKLYELDPVKKISALGLAWQVALKKTKVKLDILTDTDMLLMVQKLLEEEYVTLFIDMQKLITGAWKIMIEIKNCHIFNIGI